MDLLHECLMRAAVLHLHSKIGFLAQVGGPPTPGTIPTFPETKTYVLRIGVLAAAMGQCCHAALRAIPTMLSVEGA